MIIPSTLAADASRQKDSDPGPALIGLFVGRDEAQGCEEGEVLCGGELAGAAGLGRGEIAVEIGGGVETATVPETATAGGPGRVDGGGHGVQG